MVAAVGTLGDTLPFIAVGNELSRRGHEVALVSSPEFERKAREASLDFVPVGTLEEYREFIEDKDLWDPDTVIRSVVKHWLHHTGSYYQAIARLHRPRETVLLTTPGFFSARIAQEKFEIPLAAGFVTPSRIRSRFDPRHPARPFPRWSDPFVRSRLGLRFLYGVRRSVRGENRMSSSVKAVVQEVQRVRLAAGLPTRSPEPHALKPQVVLCMWPSWFSPPQRDWPEEAKTTGFPLYPTPQSARLVPDESAPRESAPVVFTRGSVASDQRSFFVAAAECCRLLRRSGILLTPHSKDVPPELPPGVTHVSFATLERLFADAAAVVHHGGIGTIAFALAAGVPQIAVPIVGEQFDLAYRLERLGVGRMLTTTPLSAARLSRAVESVLRSKRIRRQCRLLRSRFDSDSGCSLAADLVEQLASNRGSRLGAS